MIAEKSALAVALDEVAQKLEGLAAGRSEEVEITLLMCARRLRVALLLGARLDRPFSSPKS